MIPQLPSKCCEYSTEQIDTQRLDGRQWEHIVSHNSDMWWSSPTQLRTLHSNSGRKNTKAGSTLQKHHEVAALNFLKGSILLRPLQLRLCELEVDAFGYDSREKTRHQTALQRQLNQYSGAYDMISTLIGRDPMAIVACYVLDPWLVRPLRFLPWIQMTNETNRKWRAAYNSTEAQALRNSLRNLFIDRAHYDQKHINVPTVCKANAVVGVPAPQRTYQYAQYISPVGGEAVSISAYRVLNHEKKEVFRFGECTLPVANVAVAASVTSTAPEGGDWMWDVAPGHHHVTVTTFVSTSIASRKRRKVCIEPFESALNSIPANKFR